MKKIILILCLMISLCGCQLLNKAKNDSEDRYKSLIEMLKAHESFSDGSSYYNITGQMAKIDDGYRYYITIDSPSIAMFDLEAIAIEKGVDYNKTMAANIGIFEENEYCLVPNQTNPDKGYYAGAIMSGVSSEPETSLYIFVQFKNEDYSNNHSEYIKLDVKYEEE